MTTPITPNPTGTPVTPSVTPADPAPGTTKGLGGAVGTAVGTGLKAGVTPKGDPLYTGKITNITQAYQELFGRQPDAKGLAYWSSMPLDQAIQGMKQSPEYQSFQNQQNTNAATTQQNNTLAGAASLQSYALQNNGNTYVPNANPNSTTKGQNEAILQNQMLGGANAGKYNLPGSMQQTYTGIQNHPEDMLNPNTGQVQGYTTADQQHATAGQAIAGQATGTLAGYQTNPGAAQYNASIIGSMTPQALAVQGQVDPRSLMQNQYSELMNFPPDQVPDWAKGAVTAANQALAAHGLAGSSVAGQAITSALMQAALPLRRMMLMYSPI